MWRWWAVRGLSLIHILVFPVNAVSDIVEIAGHPGQLYLMVIISQLMQNISGCNCHLRCVNAGMLREAHGSQYEVALLNICVDLFCFL